MTLNPQPLPPIEIHDVPSDPRGAGRCAFAKRDIERGEVVTEYTEEMVSLEEAEVHEQRYKGQGKTCALMILESQGRQIAIDPYHGNDLGCHDQPFQTSRQPQTIYCREKHR